MAISIGVGKPAEGGKPLSTSGEGRVPDEDSGIDTWPRVRGVLVEDGMPPTIEVRASTSSTLFERRSPFRLLNRFRLGVTFLDTNEKRVISSGGLTIGLEGSRTGN